MLDGGFDVKWIVFALNICYLYCQADSMVYLLRIVSKIDCFKIHIASPLIHIERGLCRNMCLYTLYLTPL